eukprot:CAMPEP_0172906964 /NCGR_PEP_ID=MMETSP1075-20121228/177885_1 /TAXON_ID=2916 /ORGANISM="Ceratium fusus, Strain PA161109" /LENGTH=653 /DNA_ID=CAMNT_0013764493 /DNA_START=40 /DNA_END=1998 /DNA_ORIENTATION=-
MAKSFLFVHVFLQAVSTAFACTAIVVGKDASATGYPIVTHSEDSGPATLDVRFIRIPRKTWPKGSRRPLYYWPPGYPRVVSSTVSPEYAPVNEQKETAPIGYIPQVEKTWAYWHNHYGVQNERGLSIAETTCSAKTVGWQATPDKPWGYNKASITELSMIALERCETARCAVETMGPLAVELGFYSEDSGPSTAPTYISSAECLAIADAVHGEVWIFHAMTGKGNASALWAAQRMPSDHILSMDNSFVIRKMKLNDPDNYLYSPKITELAEEMGWWSPEKETSPEVFDFYGAYGYLPGPQDTPTNLLSLWEFYAGRRMWRVWNLLTPEAAKSIDPNKGHLPDTPNPYPFSLPAPKGSITVQMLMDAHRDHYEGTPYDLTVGMAAGPYGSPNRAMPPVVGQWERAISMFRTAWSQIVEAKPNGRGIAWLGYDAAHGTAYLPFYAGATEGAPEAWRSHEGYQSKFSMKVAWWAFNLVNQYSDLNFRLINAEVQKKAHIIEAEGQEAIAKWEKEASALDEGTALAALTKRSNAFAEAKLAEWWELAFHLFAKYGRMVVTFNESETNGEDKFGQAYPDWWLASPEVGYQTWSRSGPFHGVLEKPATSGLAIEMRMLPALSTLLAGLATLFIAVGFAHEVGRRSGRAAASMDVYVAQP